MGWSNETEDYSYEELVTETAAAYLVLIEDREVWLPKSQCEINEDSKEITVPNWLAMEEALI